MTSQVDLEEYEDDEDEDEGEGEELYGYDVTEDEDIDPAIAASSSSNSFFSLSGYDPNLLRIWVASVLKARLKEEVIPVDNDFVGEVDGFDPVWFMEIPFSYSNSSARPSPLIEWTVRATEKKSVPTMNVVREVRPKFGNRVIDVPVFTMIVHWGKFVDSQAFIKASDKEKLLEAALAYKQTSLPYKQEAFPLEALSWAESAKRFFSADLREKFAKHNVSQQMGVVLSGPPGCGKTMFLRHLASTLDMEMEHFPPSRLAYFARRGSPLPNDGMIVFDDVEEVLQERQGGDSTSILPWLLLQTDARDVWVSRLLVMVTNHPDKLDDALLRPGRFDSELKFEMPSREQVFAALKFHMADCFEEKLANYVVDKIMLLETRTLAHVSYLARIVYSGFVESWDEAIDNLKKYSAYSGVKDGAHVCRPGAGFGHRREY